MKSTRSLLLPSITLITMLGWSVSAGCGKDTPAPEPDVESSGAQATQASSSPGQVTGKVSPPQELKPAPAPPEVKAAPVSIDGVPDLALEVVSNKAAKKARSLNSKALKHHKKAAWDPAIETYIDGLRQDPGHILMRYNLGCAYAMNGQDEEALTILRQFKAAEGCGLCVGRLVRATSDTDWKLLWGDEEFIALTSNVTPVEHDYKKLARRFFKNMGKAYWALMKRTVDAGHSFRVNISYPPNHKGMVITDGSSLARWKVDLGGSDATMSPGELPASKIKCRGACCSVKKGHYGVELAVAELETVCFWPVDDETVVLHAVKLHYLDP